LQAPTPARDWRHKINDWTLHRLLIAFVVVMIACMALEASR